MNIKDRIQKLGKYFQEMQITTVSGQQIIYVVVSFPNNWIIDEDIEKKYHVNVEKAEDGSYYFCADMEVGEEAIFDAIEYNIEKMQSAIERGNLLRTKIEELRKLFEDENISLETLRSLKFSYDSNNDDELVITKNSRGNKNRDNKNDE